MSSLTGSIRLADLHSSAVVVVNSASPSTAVVAAESIADFARAAVQAVPNINADPWFPGLETAARLAQALKRPGQFARAADEELREERLNVLTHALGLALSTAGFVCLLSTVLATGGWLRIASCGVYGASLILMYAASTFFHAAERQPLKLRFQLCDHISIYLLIAGTYTPFMAMRMQGVLGFALLACVWALAAVGIAIKVNCAQRLEETSPLPCVGLGWLGLVAIKPLVAAVPAGGMVLLIAGGVSFSFGVIFYCRDDRRFFHAIWHLFVMGGTACHFCAILFYVVG